MLVCEYVFVHVCRLVNECAKIRKYLWYRIKGKLRIENSYSARSQIPVIPGMYVISEVKTCRRKYF